jgi:hypothetical protein
MRRQTRRGRGVLSLCRLLPPQIMTPRSLSASFAVESFSQDSASQAVSNSRVCASGRDTAGKDRGKGLDPGVLLEHVGREAVAVQQALKLVPVAYKRVLAARVLQKHLWVLAAQPAEVKERTSHVLLLRVTPIDLKEAHLLRFHRRDELPLPDLCVRATIGGTHGGKSIRATPAPRPQRADGSPVRAAPCRPRSSPSTTTARQPWTWFTEFNLNEA